MNKLRRVAFCPACGLATNGAAICACGELLAPPGPKILVSCFVYCGDKLLFMKRDNEPRRGYWAIPAGFMESGETLREAAAREVWEETGVTLPPESLIFYMAGSISDISEVYVAFRAEVHATCGEAGSEAQDVGWFTREELDWDNIAYPSVNHSIEAAFEEVSRGRFHTWQASYSGDLASFEPVT